LVGIISKQEIREGVFLADALTKVVDVHVMTSVLNTNENEEPLVELEEVDLAQEVIQPCVNYADRKLFWNN
jgi:hypothetical protein